ncbi:M20/M25/M40 family metallo-hydrolase [Brachybacterium sp. ACRRE]|uniref:M20/M25/M40 family metallo-hydrolase n=1 Tax=Brachybacterium sp. ACRRE TaxID=2918184 RepID=UPI001EF22FDF|nr:M20/M25/M40 family metallo-hydrolase [Brachybacterium sp. ACRRE]
MPLSAPTQDELELLQDEAVQITRDLIRIDTSNFGGNKGPGEREAADYVAGRLREVGYEPEIMESEPGRASVVLRIPGEDRERGGLVIHGHLDVVPANAEDWSVDPFAAEVRDGVLYGRGAVDMKDMDGMILALVRHLARTGQKPPRDLVIVMFADEEAGGVLGSRWMVAHRPEIFEGCTEAISEVGGYSITVPEKDTGRDVRAYLLQTAEKGYAWMRLRAHGRAGHGSVPNDENAIVRLSRAIAAIDAHEFPFEYIASVRTLFDRVGEISGRDWDEEDPAAFLPLLGGARQFVSGTLSDTANATTLRAGYKGNVIPQTAEAELDCRFLPGHQDELLALIDELSGPDVEMIVDTLGISLDAPDDTPFVAAMHRAILAEDPGAELLPYCLSGGTDNKQLAGLGITGYGFAPLQLPADLDFAPLFHGIDERVPVDSIRFGARVLLRLVSDC